MERNKDWNSSPRSVSRKRWGWSDIRNKPLAHLHRGYLALCSRYILSHIVSHVSSAYQSTILTYSARTTGLFETDPFLGVARQMPFWVACLLTTGIWGWCSTRFRTIREPLSVGFLVFTSGIIGLATIQPNASTKAVIFSGLAGMGFGALIVLLVTGVQLSTPHHVITTATALFVSSRAISAAVFTAIYVAAFSARLNEKLPAYVGKAVVMAGLPATSVPAFVKALAALEIASLRQIPGVTPAIIAAGVAALKQAYADSVRVVWIIAAPFGVVACIGCLFLGDLQSTMNYRVDAPMEELAVKDPHKKVEYGA